MRWIFVVIAVAWIFRGHAAFAETGPVWRWTDESGAVHITSALTDVPVKHRSGAVSMKLSTVAEPSAEPASKPDPLETERIARFDSSEGMVAVRAVIGESIERAAWIDTGSEFTIITSKLAVALGVDARNAEKRVFHTQGGRVSAPVTTLKSVKVGPAVARDVPAAIMDFPGRGPVSAIIGMNFLSLFRFEINMRDGVIIFGDRMDTSSAGDGRPQSASPLKNPDAR